MTRQKPDNKPPANTKLLKFTGRSDQSDSDARAPSTPEELIGQALAIAFFDGGASVESNKNPTVSSLGSFAAPAGKRAIVVRQKAEDNASAAVAPIGQQGASLSTAATSTQRKKTPR